MNAMGRLLATIGAFLIAGCVAYHPAPIDPGEKEREFLARSLDDSRFIQFVATRDASVDTTPSRLTLPFLRLAAIYYNFDVAEAEAAVRAADARLISAGERPNPAASITPEYSVNPPKGDSPWVLGASLDFKIETGGRRDARLAVARHACEEAREHYAHAAWGAVSRVRPAAAELIYRIRLLECAARETAARTEILRALRARLEAGDASSGEVAAAAASRAAAEAAQQKASAEVGLARSALSAALDLPESALARLQLDPAFFTDIPRAEDLAMDRVQRAGILHRPDVRAALASYARADAELQLAVASQYPELHLSPGYLFDQGQNKFTLGISLDVPLFHNHGGAIGEAAVARDAAAAVFVKTQARAIGELQAARGQCAARAEEAAAAKKRLDLLHLETARNIQYMEAGEASRDAVLQAQLGEIRAEVDVAGSQLAVQMALSRLEGAMMRPLESLRSAESPP
jgi:outer membrane protein TolC